jgi:hypothetical protein
MLETFFGATKTLRRLRAGPSGPYFDGFFFRVTRCTSEPGRGGRHPKPSTLNVLCCI